ncbi:MAG TPA: hypothetical protein VJT73_07320 [Polyangiaceae bacterium]|nr:hypothetical protein [Polyangiaceae bacterium]HKY35564.1 hypothetical protein [Polyangiaceae bacterium]
MSGFLNQPKILRGAFVEFGISIPPLIVVFQFNPLTISRTRSASIRAPSTPEASQATQNAGLLAQLASGGASTLVTFRHGQTISVQPERMSFDVRLDATDKLNDGDTLTEQFGITPQLATLEQMMLPKTQSVLGGAVSALLGGAPTNFAFFDEARDPPVILFVWGRKKILPVNITQMQIREEQFSTDLNPTRAIVSVSLEVIEGPNAPYLYSKTLQEVMSLLNLANITDLANTMVPA